MLPWQAVAHGAQHADQQRRTAALILHDSCAAEAVALAAAALAVSGSTGLAERKRGAAVFASVVFASAKLTLPLIGTGSAEVHECSGAHATIALPGL